MRLLKLTLPSELDPVTSERLIEAQTKRIKCPVDRHVRGIPRVVVPQEVRQSGGHLCNQTLILLARPGEMQSRSKKWTPRDAAL